MKYTRSIFFAMILASLIFGSGCASSPGTHLRNLTNDFFDISRLSAGVGPLGYGVDIKATKLLELKADNYEDVYKVGWIGRGSGVWNEDSMGYAISMKQIPIVTATTTAEEAGEMRMTETSSMGFQADFLLGGSELPSPRWIALFKEKDVDERKFMELCNPSDELRIALYLGVIGADVGLRPVEFVDFVLGLLTLGHVDLLKDDHLSGEANNILWATP